MLSSPARYYQKPRLEKEFLKSCESCLRKSQFSTLTDINTGFGGPWDRLGIFFVTASS